MHIRVVVVARNAGGFSTTLRSVACQRSQTSCTMSSASAALPSTRYAIPNKRGRASTKAERPSSWTPLSDLWRAGEAFSDIGCSAIAVVIVYRLDDDRSIFQDWIARRFVTTSFR